MNKESKNEIFLLSPWVDSRVKRIITSLQLIKYYLEDNGGYKAEVIDCSLYPENLNEVMKILGRSNKPIIGVTAYTVERFQAYELIRKIRSVLPESWIIVGGRHFGFLPEETLSELPEVDIVVRGEGEITFKEICDFITKGRPGLEDILGISYKTGSTIIHNNDRPLEDNIDLFRSYDVHSKSDLNKDFLLSHIKTDEFNKYFSVHATRGCPNRCVYCSLRSSKVRYRKIDNIIQEIKDKIEATGVKNVSFTDSSLTISKKFVIDLCKAILENKLNINWRCYSRVNIDINLLKIMRKAGLSAVEIGLESGSPEVLKAIRKNIDLDQVNQFCKIAHKLGIRVWVFCMISLPEENYDDAIMTLSFVRKISQHITNAGLQTTRITPDATLCQIAKDKGLLNKNFNWFKPYKTPHVDLTRPWDSTLPIYIENLSPDQIKYLHKEFDSIKLVKLANFSALVQGLKYNMKFESIKKLTFNSFIRKSRIACVVFFNSVRNLRKYE